MRYFLLQEYCATFVVGLKHVIAKASAVLHALKTRTCSVSENSKELQDRAARVSIKAQFRHPTLQIPQNSVSNDMLVIRPDMVTVTNSFQILVPGRVDTLPVIIEEVTVQVEDLGVFR